MTIEELHLKYTEFQREWNRKIKRKAVNQAIGTKPGWKLPEDLNCIIKGHSKPAVPSIYAQVIEKTITVEIIDDFNSEIEDLAEEICDNLYFQPSLDTQKEYILHRLNEVQEEIHQNEFFGTGIIRNYPTSIFSEGIVDQLYPLISTKTKDFIAEKTANRPDLKDGFYCRELLEDFSSLYKMNQLILEFELLTNYYNSFEREIPQVKNTAKNFNPYSLVFSSKNTFNFFMYCMSHYPQERVKPQLFAKYYILFKEEKYIIGNKLKSYKDFVEAEFDLKVSRPRSDKSLQPEDAEFLNHIDNFKKIKGIKDLK